MGQMREGSEVKELSVLSKKSGPALSTRAALALCLERGHPLTCQSLYNAAIKWGFGGREGTRYRFNPDGLDAYLTRAVEQPGAEWITLRQAADRGNVPFWRIYRSLDRGEVTFRSFGAGTGVFHVRLDQFEEFEQKYQKDNYGT